MRSPDSPAALDDKNTRMRGIWNSEPTLTVKDLAKIQCPVLVLAGDDEQIGFQYICSMYEAIPEGQLAIIPGTSHYVVKEKPELVQAVIKQFLADLSTPVTRAPVRRNNPETL